MTKLRTPWRHPMMLPFYFAAVLAFAMPARAYSAVYVAPSATTADIIDAGKKVVSVTADVIVRAWRWIDSW